jgi:DNA-binding IclR family transcriptional regulator
MSGVQAVDKAIEVLQAVATTPAGIREVASNTGISKSTVHRLFVTLERHELVVHDQATGLYRVGPRVLRLGMAYLGDLDIRSKAIPHMQRLRDVLGETVGLTVHLDDQRLYIEQIESRLELKVKAEVGRPYPLYSGAPGRLLLAYMDDAAIDAYLSRTELAPLAPHTPQTAEEVWNLVREIRRVGHSSAVEETIAGLATIAVPVRDHMARVVAALSVSGPVSRFDAPQREQALAILVERGQALSGELGFWVKPEPDRAADGGQRSPPTRAPSNRTVNITNINGTT